MSDRSSFVTEYMDCEDCFEAAKKILISNTKSLKSIVIPSWSEHEEFLPIIAGKIGSPGGGMEFIEWENYIIPALNEVICHDIRIAIISECYGEKFLVASPENKIED